MPIFAVTHRYSDDVATLDALRTEHRDYLRGLADQNLLLVSGPFGPTDPAGALLLFHTDSTATATAGTSSGSHLQLRPRLPRLLRRLCITIREFCPTWEEWQAAVDLRAVVEQEPATTWSGGRHSRGR